MSLDIGTQQAVAAYRREARLRLNGSVGPLKKMILTPLKGIDLVTFGMSLAQVIAALGEPDGIVPIRDVNGYPKGRENLQFGGIDILTTPDIGVLTISIDTSVTDAVLYGIPFARLTVRRITKAIRTQGFMAVVTKADGWGDFAVVCSELGLVCSFSADGLEDVEMSSLKWKGPNQLVVA